MRFNLALLSDELESAFPYSDMYRSLKFDLICRPAWRHVSSTGSTLCGLACSLSSTRQAPSRSEGSRHAPTGPCLRTCTGRQQQ